MVYLVYSTIIINSEGLSRFGLLMFVSLSVTNSQGHINSRFGLLGFNASATVRVISRFGLLGLNVSVTARVILRFGLVC